MSDDRPNPEAGHGYNPPPREKTDCDRCGDAEVVAFVDRDQPALCADCEKEIAECEVPSEDREITPTDRRLFWP